MPRFLSPCPGRHASGRHAWRIAAVLFLFAALTGCQLFPHAIYKRLDLGPGTPQVRVFMIGDSLTYYNDLPGLLQQFSVHEKAPFHIEECLTAYTSLGNHLDNGSSIQRIRGDHFDYVVLQDFSRKPVTDPESCIQDFVTYDREIKAAGGTTIVFQNWTRRGRADEYPALLKTYTAIVRQTGATLAPVGTAWKLCAAERPDIRLLVDDRHPSEEGSYLAACVLYDVIDKKNSADLPANLQGPDISPSVRTALRSIADRTVFAP